MARPAATATRVDSAMRAALAPARRLLAIVAAPAALSLGLPAAAAELPIFDAHIHYSHDAWDNLPPKDAVAILRQAGQTALPPEDLISDLATAQLDGRPLRDEELLMFLDQLLVAGNETTRNLLSGSMVAIAEHPAEGQLLFPALDAGAEATLDAAVDEFLRLPIRPSGPSPPGPQRRGTGYTAHRTGQRALSDC